MSYFTFNQNNSGGSFLGSQYIIIEADNADEANERAVLDAGIYFDGVSTGDDCPCCGDRWWRVSEEDATDAPTIYGRPIETSDSFELFPK